MAELWQWNAPRLSAAFGSGEVSPVEVATSLLRRIAALDTQVNAYCLIDEPATLAQARASEERWKKNAPLSPLDGVPVAVKDVIVTMSGWCYWAVVGVAWLGGMGTMFLVISYALRGRCGF